MVSTMSACDVTCQDHMRVSQTSLITAANGDGPVDYAYKRHGKHDFAKALESVEEAVSVRGFVVHHKHDIGGTVVAKGFAIRPLVIMEVGPVEEEANVPLSLVLPCRINVYEEDGAVVLAALRPTIFSAVYPEHRLDGVAAEMEAAVIDIVDDAVAVLEKRQASTHAG